MQKTARIIEVFSSLQGEGIHVGRRHLFVRFWNCNLACHYCDTDYRGPYREITEDALHSEVESALQESGPFHAVSLTGGEPLLWPEFLGSWLPRLKSLGQITYLETNGTLPQALRKVLPWTDIIAMDLKPASATADRDVWREHEEFLTISHEARKDLFVKVVVTPDTSDADVRRSAELVRAVSSEIPLVLQPVTPWGKVTAGPSEEQILRWRAWSSERLKDVRVVPQMHRVWGVP